MAQRRKPGLAREEPCGGDGESLPHHAVEDDEKLARLLGEELGRYGFDLVRLDGESDVRSAFVCHKPDLVLLDINLPRDDGYYWCRELRKLSNVPIVFISARSDVLDQVRALENGGDDYITKPFDLELAIAKIQSVIVTYGEYSRRTESDLLQVGGVLLDRSTNRVSFEERQIELAPKEFRLLWLLAEGHGRVSWSARSSLKPFGMTSTSSTTTPSP